MKKIMFAIVGMAMILATSVSSFASQASVNVDKDASVSVSMTADHEHKPCHASKSNGNRCDCRDCCGNNWGNYYCTRCGHSVEKHY